MYCRRRAPCTVAPDCYACPPCGSREGERRVADVVITEYINDAAAETLRSTFSVHYDPTLVEQIGRAHV